MADIEAVSESAPIRVEVSGAQGASGANAVTGFTELDASAALNVTAQPGVIYTVQGASSASFTDNWDAGLAQAYAVFVVGTGTATVGGEEFVPGSLIYRHRSSGGITTNFVVKGRRAPTVVNSTSPTLAIPTYIDTVIADVDTAGGTITVLTSPKASVPNGWKGTFVLKGTAGNLIIKDIDTSATITTLTTDGESVTLFTDGTTWYVLGQPPQRPFVTVTATSASIARTTRKLIADTDTAGGHITLTLPTEATAENGWDCYIVRKGTAGNVIVKDDGGTTIYTLTGLLESATLSTDGTDWYII